MKFFVTGANRGIGAALVVAGKARGHEVIGATRTGVDGTVKLDLSDPNAIAAQLQGAPNFDVLINNAGIYGPDWPHAAKMDYAAFAETFAVNTMAPLAVATALLPQLRASRTPKILTISSQMSYMGYRKSTKLAYRASKAAVNKVMQGLSQVLESDNIPVALIDPGWVRTDMGGAEAEEDPHEVAAGIIEIAEKLSMKDTGKFFRFTGEERPF
ncbi:MAG: SDR family NAD(P)-dependent oxidoreductase [Pseudomonadota bacterium]